MNNILEELRNLLDEFEGHLSIAHKLDKILANQEKIMSALSDLQAAVSAEDTVIDSAITLLQGLAQALKDAGTDPVALAALQADIVAKTQSLATAVATNTPTPP